MITEAQLLQFIEAQPSITVPLLHVCAEAYHVAPKTLKQWYYWLQVQIAALEELIETIADSEHDKAYRISSADELRIMKSVEQLLRAADITAEKTESLESLALIATLKADLVTIVKHLDEFLPMESLTERQTVVIDDLCAIIDDVIISLEPSL